MLMYCDLLAKSWFTKVWILKEVPLEKCNSEYIENIVCYDLLLQVPFCEDESVQLHVVSDYKKWSYRKR